MAKRPRISSARHPSSGRAWKAERRRCSSQAADAPIKIRLHALLIGNCSNIYVAVPEWIFSRHRDGRSCIFVLAFSLALLAFALWQIRKANRRNPRV